MGENFLAPAVATALKAEDELRDRHVPIVAAASVAVCCRWIASIRSQLCAIPAGQSCVYSLPGIGIAIGQCSGSVGGRRHRRVVHLLEILKQIFNACSQARLPHKLRGLVGRRWRRAERQRSLRMLLGWQMRHTAALRCPLLQHLLMRMWPCCLVRRGLRQWLQP